MTPESWSKCETSIERHEGLRLTKYLDTKVNWTVGIGHKITPYDGNLDRITEDQAYSLLSADMTKTESELMKTWPDYNNCDDPRQAVLLEMAFNLGVAGLMQFRKMLDAVIEKQYYLAEACMLDSLWARQVGMRAQDLAHVMVSGDM